MNMRIGPADAGLRANGASIGASIPRPLGRGRAADELALRQSAEALEGVFVQQLFQAMRASVPTDGLLERGAGEDMFGSMLDEHVAEEVARQGGGPNDLSTAIFESLRKRLGPPSDTVR